jgi:hypothetical protein
VTGREMVALPGALLRQEVLPPHRYMRVISGTVNTPLLFRKNILYGIWGL